MQYKRVLLKLSGEALMGDRQYGIDPKRLQEYAKEIKEANAIYKAEIPNLNKLKNLDGYTETDLAALRIGIILSAQVLYLKDKNYKNACEIYNAVDQWFDTEEDFEDFFTEFLKGCKNL